MEKQLFVVTSAKRANSVLLNGIRCNANGEIWLFENKRISGYIQNKRVFIPMSHIVATHCDLSNFAVISVDPKGIETIERAETCKPNPKQLEAFHFLWIAKQLSISPRYLKIQRYEHFDRARRKWNHIQEEQQNGINGQQEKNQQSGQPPQRPETSEGTSQSSR